MRYARPLVPRGRAAAVQRKTRSPTLGPAAGPVGGDRAAGVAARGRCPGRVRPHTGRCQGGAPPDPPSPRGCAPPRLRRGPQVSRQLKTTAATSMPPHTHHQQQQLRTEMGSPPIGLHYSSGPQGPSPLRCAPGELLLFRSLGLRPSLCGKDQPLTPCAKSLQIGGLTLA